MVQNDVQTFINELVVLSEAMSILLTGRIKTVGDQTTREWTYNATDFGTKGVSYQSGDFIKNKFGKDMFPKHSIYMNGFDT